MGRSYYFIGIGGIGMSSLAHLLLDRGASVSGEDSKQTPIIEALQKRGAQITDKLSGSPIVIYSSAIPVNHPRRIEALQKGLKCMHRSELLKEVMEEKRALLVAGTHGKTSSSSLLAHMLDTCGYKPSFVIGGIAPSLIRHGRWNDGEYFVAEADESDGSFLNLQGYGGIITNVEKDHLDFWKSHRALYEGFSTFANQLESPELTFWSADDPTLRKLNIKGWSYGRALDADARLTSLVQEKEGLCFSMTFQGKEIKDLFLPLVGEYQALNCMAAFALAMQLGCAEERLREGLRRFKGIKRRLELKGVIKGISIYDDYAHHPTAISQMIQSLKAAVGARRVITIFEPHRYSRTEEMMEEFAAALSLSNTCIITDIYGAGEAPIKGVTGERLYQKVDSTQAKFYVPRPELKEKVLAYCQAGDVVVTVGAGPITKLSDELVEGMQ